MDERNYDLACYISSNEMAVAVSLYVISYMAERCVAQNLPAAVWKLKRVYRSYSCRPSKRPCSRWARGRRGRSRGGTGTARTASTTGLVAPQVPARLLSSDRLDAPTCRTTTTGMRGRWERSERNYGSGSGNPSRPAVATVPVSERCERVAGTRRRSWKWVHPTYNRGTSWHSAEQAEAEALRRLQLRKKRSRRACHRAATRQPP